jgi:indole-3-glycerol phosphate synthase
MDRQRVLAASRDEVRRLAGQPMREVTPSRRDFAQYVATQKHGLAVIARIAAPADPAHTRSNEELVRHARACDDADAAALAVPTGAGGFSLSVLAAIAQATTAPILRDDLLIDPRQLYAARLHGADAVILPAGELDAPALEELVTVARSLHMASVIEVLGVADMETALRLPHVLLGLRCVRANGLLDVESTRQCAQQALRPCTIIALPEVRSAAECTALRGVCDAVVAGEVLLGTTDVSTALQELTLA